MPDVVVVGGGVYGATIALALRAQGRDVWLVDGGFQESGTRASGGLCKPGWASQVARADYRAAIDLLTTLYPEAKEVPFEIRIIGKAVKRERLVWVPREAVLKHAESARVVRVVSGAVYLHHREESVQARHIIVAAGAWTPMLLPSVHVQAKWGASFDFPGMLEANVIAPYAPYKQVVAFNTPIGVWAGDGMAVQMRPHAMRILRSHDRVAQTIGLPRGQHRLGMRPVTASGPLVQLVQPGVWVATGGGKIGTIGAALAALQLRREVPA